MTNTPPQLVEKASQMIKNCIETNIAAALQLVRNDHTDQLVNTNPPQAYFFYETSKALRTPAVFIIADSMDFKLEERMANHINAETFFKISVVIEDRAEDYLTIKAWRYQAALHHVLNQTEIEDTTANVKIVITVREARFSPVFTDSGTQPNNFRKEVSLDCKVEHYENF